MGCNRNRVGIDSCFSRWDFISISDSSYVGYGQPECLYDECNIEQQSYRFFCNPNICNCDSFMCCGGANGNIKGIWVGTNISNRK